MTLQLTPEQLQAFQQLSQAYQTQQQQIATLQQELHHLHDPATTATSSMMGTATESARVQRDDSHFGLNRLLSKPSVFHGEHGNRVIDWINEFDILYENCDPHMPEMRKVTFAKQFLRDEALRWWIARERDVQRATASPEDSDLRLAVPISNWSQFKAVLKESFSLRGASEYARNELHRLKQQQFRSLAAYADRFEATSRRIEVPSGHSIDEELVATFKAGLSDGQIRLFLTNKQPRTLFQAAQLALQAESDLRVSNFHPGAGRFGTSERGSSGSHGPYRFDRGASFGRFANSGNRVGFPAGHSHSSSPSQPDRSASTVPMDLSTLARAASRSDPASDSENEDAESAGNDAEPNQAEYGEENEESSEELFDFCSTAQTKQEEQACQHCGCNVLRGQRGPPRPNKPGCWNCGQLGHLSRDCPKPRRPVVPASSTSRFSSDQSRDRPAGTSTSQPRHF